MAKDKKLKAALKSGVVLNEEMQNQVKAKQPLERDAVLVVERNRWFMICIVLALVAAYAVYSAYEANERYANSVQIYWVKMYPNGTWDVEFHDKGREKEFFPATIDALLTQFVERRFSRIRHSVKYDYGFATHFMSDKLKSEFLSSDRFNAPTVAAEFATCARCDEIHIQVRNIDHYDSEWTDFSGHEGALYRTNVFVKEQVVNEEGTVTAEYKKIVSMSWRIRTKSEMLPSREALKLNPIGLVIYKADYLNDPS